MQSDEADEAGLAAGQDAQRTGSSSRLMVDILVKHAIKHQA